MKRYKVLSFFSDGQDNFHEYNAGDTYPRKGYTPTEERIAVLSGTDNASGRPMIEATNEVIEEPIEEPKDEELFDRKKRK